MRVCPKCSNVVGFNSYFGAYICDNCGWEDDTYNKERIQYYSRRATKIIFKVKYKPKRLPVENIKK